ncbi:MAG: hypothetical protein GTN40_00925 [Candidatus Aenigmarchaeota archaeon]|nr:hypothetical protein [Candidatus Aenigmarchaeota archaeon]
MKKLLQLSIIFIVLIAGCIQEFPTGGVITNETFEPVKCIPDWNCTFWSDCKRTDVETGIQNRTCIDNNNCNIKKPQETRACGLPRITLKEPSQMALEISDLPDDKNWLIKESNIRAREKVSQIEKELGFKKGYNITYSSKEDNKTDFIDIDQFISIYPLVNSAINMSFSFEAAKESYREKGFFENNTNKIILSISDLPSPNIGDLSIAYNITILYSTTGLKENIYTICFIKWDVAEVIRVSGTESDYDFLKDLVEIAEEKIA